MPRKSLITIVLAASLLLPVHSASALLFADSRMDTPPAPAESVSGSPRELTRGEAVSKIVASFDLEAQQKAFISDCIRHADECFFAFASMSRYDGIQFMPLILYPDVFPAYRHYRAINTASILGLVHGYLDEDSSPFHPEYPMTRIQALKVVLGAAGLLKWKDQFELSDNDYPRDLPFTDSVLASPDAWWYGRYLKFALDANLIDSAPLYGPDDAITDVELSDLVARTSDFIPPQNEKTSSPAGENA